jgi:hypothetical protein
MTNNRHHPFIKHNSSSSAGRPVNDTTVIDTFELYAAGKLSDVLTTTIVFLCELGGHSDFQSPFCVASR